MKSLVNGSAALPRLLGSLLEQLAEQSPVDLKEEVPLPTAAARNLEFSWDDIYYIHIHIYIYIYLVCVYIYMYIYYV